MRSQLRLIGIVSLALLLTISLIRCGGGGESTEKVQVEPNLPAEPTLTPMPIKTFHFSWNDVSEAIHYKLLENPDGVSGFSQVGNDIPQGTQEVDHIVPLYARVNAQYILQTCDSRGCNDSTPAYVTGTLVDAIGYFKGVYSLYGGGFGSSVSLSADGNVLLVGAEGEDIMPPTDILVIGAEGEPISAPGTEVDPRTIPPDWAPEGAAYIFMLGDNGWLQQAHVKASNTEAGDFFGNSVSLSADGNTLAVGAKSEDGSATGIDGDQTDNSAYAAGAVYVFTLSDGDCSQQAYIKASNTGSGDNFGSSVSLSADGNTLAVGAVHEDSSATGIDGEQAGDLALSAGAVYIFTRSESGWSQQAYVKASNTEAGDFFGNSVSLSTDGNTLAVGAVREGSSATGIDGDQSDDLAHEAGAVYVFTRSGSDWSQQAYVKASNTGTNDAFGGSVTLSADGNTLAVGAAYEDSSATGIDGNQSDDSQWNAGAVYLFTRSGSDWSQQAYVKASNTGRLDHFGGKVTLSADGNTLAVGAAGEDSSAAGIDGDQTADSVGYDTGAVYVFTRSGSDWSQQAYVKASNPGTDTGFGGSVSLSADGNTLAVGAEYEGSHSELVSNGAVYLY